MRSGHADATYLRAAREGDMAAAQGIVDAAARAAGCLAHVTPTKNLASIMADGLRPHRPDDAEDIEGVYLFPGRDEAEDAIMNWLGDRFDQEVDLSVLYVHPDGVGQPAPGGAPWEVVAARAIEPRFIFPSDPVEIGPGGEIIPPSERFLPRVGPRTRPCLPGPDRADEPYLRALAAGDAAAAGQALDAEARAAGFGVGPVWHGTRAAFDRFDPATRGPRSIGFHFTDSEGEAWIYATSVARWAAARPARYDEGWDSCLGIKRSLASPGERVIRARLRLLRPLRVTTGEIAANAPLDREPAEWLRRAQAGGHDGIVAERRKGDRWDHAHYVVFSPDQIAVVDPDPPHREGGPIPPSRRFAPADGCFPAQRAAPAAAAPWVSPGPHR